MPALDGYTATSQIRRIDHPVAQEIPIIAVTANAMSGDRRQCIEAGMTDYVSKPIDRNNLILALDRAINAKHALPRAA